MYDIAGNQTATPEIVSEQDGGTVDKLCTVKLDCDTENCKIYYTLDGTAPELHRLQPRVRIFYYHVCLSKLTVYISFRVNLMKYSLKVIYLHEFLY